MKEILIKVKINDSTEPELFPYFVEVPTRKRAEMARRLMVDGLRCKNQSANQPQQSIISPHEDHQTDAELLDKDSEKSNLFSL